MTPGVQFQRRVNIDGHAGQQLTPSVYGSTASVQWNLEGGSADRVVGRFVGVVLNFDALNKYSVVSGGGDVLIDRRYGGLSINLITNACGGGDMFYVKQRHGRDDVRERQMQSNNVGGREPWRWPSDPDIHHSR